MELTSREFWALIHGILLGGAFLVAFTGGLAGFYSLRPEYVTEAGIVERTRRLVLGTGVMAALTWLTVIVGTWIVYRGTGRTPPTVRARGCPGFAAAAAFAPPRRTVAGWAERLPVATSGGVSVWSAVVLFRCASSCGAGARRRGRSPAGRAQSCSQCAFSGGGAYRLWREIWLS